MLPASDTKFIVPCVALLYHIFSWHQS